MQRFFRECTIHRAFQAATTGNYQIFESGRFSERLYLHFVGLASASLAFMDPGKVRKVIRVAGRTSDDETRWHKPHLADRTLTLSFVSEGVVTVKTVAAWAEIHSWKA